MLYMWSYWCYIEQLCDLCLHIRVFMGGHRLGIHQLGTTMEAITIEEKGNQRISEYIIKQ